MSIPVAMLKCFGTAVAVSMALGFGNSVMAQDPGAGEGTAPGLQPTQDLRPVYEIVYYSSVNSSGTSAPVAIVKNNDDEECETEVTWFFGGSGAAACQTVVVAQPGTWVRHCARRINGQQLIGVCDDICDPELTFNEGFAEIAVEANCRNRTAVHAFEYYSATDPVGPEIQGTRTLSVVKLPPGKTKGD